MCGGIFGGGGGGGSAPPPPPLPPPPPPPLPPKAPIPEAEPVREDVNPQVRQAKQKKAQGEYAQGTGSLRIPLQPQVNTPTTGPKGGVQS